MSRGPIARASRRYPRAQRRAARYGRTQAGRRPNGLPPQLLPGVTGRANGDGSVRLRIAIASALLAILLVIGGLIATTVSTVAAVGGTVAAYREVNEGLPDAALIAADTFQTTRIFDRDGKLLQEIADPNSGGWRTFVPLEKVSQHAIEATIAAEDATFWTHRGVEPVAIARGLIFNLGGSGSSGGSTIMQQLVRSLHPERIGFDVTYTRKAKEALAAVAVERQYSKHDILKMYVNLIFYGNRSYGIEAAAQTYFHKHASELTLAEASLLAGIPQQPTSYNPAAYPENAKRRQKYVLDQMVKLGYITPEERDAAYKEFPRLQIHAAREGDGAVLDHPHFVNYVHDYVAEKWGEDALVEGGLDIYTSIDSDLQDRAEEIVREQVTGQLTYYNARNAAMVVMVPHTGEILAMVGSADFHNLEIEGQVNITTSLQQPGSAIKPIVYAAAFEQGWHPGTVLLDAPFRKENPPGTVDEFGNPDPVYEPQNYTGQFFGAVTVRKALAKSLNIPAVKALEFVGIDNFLDMAKRMGIKDSLTSPERYGLAAALGGAEVYPLELTNAYATLANNGKHVPATPILKIADAGGRVLYELDRQRVYEQADQALRAEYAYQITSILTDNESRAMIFTRQNLFGQTQQELGRPTAAKSGTTNDFKDIWTLGYTTDAAIGVWVGNTRNDPLAEIDGIQGAGPIWAQMMKELHSNPEFAKLLDGPNGQPLPREFPRPPGIVDGIVCEATGGRPTENWGNRRELLAQGGPPAQRCDQLSAWQRTDLARVMQTLRGRGGNFMGGAVDGINRFARAVRWFDGGGFKDYVPPEPPRTR